MRFAVLVVTALVAGVAATAGIAHAVAPAAPLPVHVHPLQPPIGPVVDPDPVIAVQDFQGQIAELHDNWETLSPTERSQRLKTLQQVAPLIEAETRNLSPGEQLQVQGMLLSAMFQLADLLRQLR